jgi:HAD superfamily hydrolase (TIGR01509 family)
LGGGTRIRSAAAGYQMLRAIILDFNGVILDDEPLHFRAMRDAVAEFGVLLTREVYWDRYLPMDDAQCLKAICQDYGLRLSESASEATLARKVKLYYGLLQDRLPLFPGAALFIKAAAGHYPLALASGARREEIEAVLDSTGLTRCFTVIVAAEDFARGKPHPDSFLLALNRLNAEIGPRSLPVRPGECLVIEDSVAGVEGARAAGMACLAVSSSYPLAVLQSANKVVASLEEVQVADLQGLFGELP